ncbi:MAG TPA: 3-deoxy-7-phosphoheptulonate synthase [Pirellulales bacterium]|jgi:3-deoxy-7-phosphoheptulonate synthase|nr:3-deoxy-7-phosphoheptulonate synthase [Pirellulales bacterium]
MMQKTFDINVRSTVPLIAPRQLIDATPMTEAANHTIVTGREAVRAILTGTDNRLLAVVGPCSIHDETAVLDYAERLKTLAQEVAGRVMLVMRVYFEKPRTTIGWKGLINDPNLNGTFDIALGLRRARQLLLAINELGVPAATEMLEPITPQYVADLVTWASIGARTTESQTHRQMASGLSMPVGYKNATDGNLQIAVDAMLSAQHAHSFLGIDIDGRTCVVNTKGNPWGHLILRGGRSGPNYDPASVRAAAEALVAGGLRPNVMVDCSHANSDKDHRRQELAWNDVVEQRVVGNRHIIGLMLESNLIEGSQQLGDDPSKLRYGVSITDACTGWEKTRELILRAHDALAAVPELAAIP